MIRFVDGHADVWAIFRDGAVFGDVVAALAEPARSAGATKIAAVEARGFLLGGAVAAYLGVGLAAIRKEDGLYPGPKATAVTTTADYRGRTYRLRLQRSAVSAGDRVVLVDDWVESGNQAMAARTMVEDCGGMWLGMTVVVDKLRGDRRGQLGPIHGLIDAAQLDDA